MTSDFIALVLQAVGGAIADTASNKVEADRGTHIMVAGLAFQVLSLLAFMAVAGAFSFNVKRHQMLERGAGSSFVVEKVNGRSAKSFRTFLFGESTALLLPNVKLIALLSSSIRSSSPHPDSFLLPCRGVSKRIQRQASQ